jgi:hypothetical protein
VSDVDDADARVGGVQKAGDVGAVARHDNSTEAGCRARRDRVHHIQREWRDLGIPPRPRLEIIPTMTLFNPSYHVKRGREQFLLLSAIITLSLT